jgi:hypothetical protein
MHHMDLRKPIGLLFTLYGALLALYGWLAHPAPEGPSASLGVDRVWGAVLLVFGLSLLGVVRWQKAHRTPHG